MKDREAIQKVNFDEIKDKFAYLNMKPNLEKVKDSVKISQQAGETENKNSLLKQDNREKSEKEMKEIQELVDKIKDTSLLVKFVKDQGTLRAHILNRINNELLAIIPGYLKANKEFEEVSNIFSKMNDTVLGAVVSANTGSNVDSLA